MKVKSFRDTIDWYNANAKKYSDASENTYSVDELDDFSALLAKGDRVLDAGCASGRDTALLEERGFNVTGIDLSSGLIKLAREKHPNITFVEGSFLKMDFPDNSFEGVWAHASLVHLETEEDTNRAVEEFYRVLTDEGIIHILVKAQTGEKKTAVVSDSLSGHDRFFQYYTQTEVREMLEKIGFVVIHLEQYKETDKTPDGRPEVEWILVLAKK